MRFSKSCAQRREGTRARIRRRTEWSEEHGALHWRARAGVSALAYLPAADEPGGRAGVRKGGLSHTVCRAHLLAGEAVTFTSVERQRARKHARRRVVVLLARRRHTARRAALHTQMWSETVYAPALHPHTSENPHTGKLAKLLAGVLCSVSTQRLSSVPSNCLGVHPNVPDGR